MNLEVLTPGKTVFSGHVKLIKVPGSGGSFEVMVNHAPIISTLAKGVIKVVVDDDNTKMFTIDSGVIQVVSNKVIVLAESLAEVQSS